MILIFVGGSAVGKNTIARRVLREYCSDGHVIRSSMTRDSRADDKPDECEFITREEMEELHREGKLLWMIEVHGNYYAYRKSYILEAGLPEYFGHIFVIYVTLDCVPQLVEFLKKEKISHLCFFIHCNSEGEIRRRLIVRGENPEAIEGRVRESMSRYPQALIAAGEGIPYIFLQNRHEGDLRKAVDRVLDEISRYTQ